MRLWVVDHSWLRVLDHAWRHILEEAKRLLLLVVDLCIRSALVAVIVVVLLVALASILKVFGLDESDVHDQANCDYCWSKIIIAQHIPHIAGV